MTSLDVRSNSAVMKRAEQLKRWEESETNREPPTPKPEKGRKIKFSSGCVFLAACLSGDKEEVLKLLEHGADINTANVDGLTALHQACIDDNLEMVEFLVEHGADINRQDNEGWTPLHATASCGFVSIARYLVEHGAEVAAVNSDGDLAVDLAVDIQHLPMMDFMQKMVTELNIDCEKARKAEEQLMLNDAKKWLRSDASEVDRPHPKTGATALHVAAAKGYTKVLGLLLAGRANVDKQDNDGWTPLHAASHWGQKEAAEMLVDAMADIDMRNYAGQTCIDVAERKMVKFLEELRASKRIKRRPSSQIRISDTIENHIDNAPTKIIRVEVKNELAMKEQPNVTGVSETLQTINDEQDQHNLSRISECEETDSDLTDSTESSHSTSLSEPEDEKPKLVADSFKPADQSSEEEAPWRRNSFVRLRLQNETPVKNQVPDKEISKVNNTTESSSSDVILRRTQSFENDKFYQKYHELRARIKANSCPILPATQISNMNNNNNNNNNNNSNITNNITSVLSNVNSTNPNTNTNTITNQNYSVQRSASLKEHRNFRKPITPPISSAAPASVSIATTTTTANTTSVIAAPIRSTPSSTTNNLVTNNATKTVNNNDNKQAPSSPSTPEATKQKMSAGTIFKNFFKSFVPPVRDEESETQRKAHAKRVRETRRSTQGVTLDEIKSAEELVKKKNSTMNNNNNSSNNDMQTTTTTLQQQLSQEDQQPPAPTTPPPTIDTTTVTSTTISTPQSTEIATVFDVQSVKIEEDSKIDDDISASFTIVAPIIRPRTLSISSINDDSDGNEDNDVSTTFTMTSRHSQAHPSPTESVETTIVVTPPIITINESQDVEKDMKFIEENSNTFASHNKENENNENKKTDNSENQIKTATPTIITAVSSSEKSDELPKQPESPSLERLRNIGAFSPLPLQSHETVNSNVSITSASSTTTTPILDSPVRMRDKRSLFELDNASSLSLAEKLRNEANKYSNEEQKSPISAGVITSDIDRDTVFSNFSSRRSLDSASLPSSPLHSKESAPSSVSSNSSGAVGTTTERRPSWRLKFDAGCKFKLEDASTGTTFPPNNSTIIPSAPAVIAAANLSSASQRRIGGTGGSLTSSNQSLNSIGRPVSAPVNSISLNANENNSNDKTTDNSTTISSIRRPVSISNTTLVSSGSATSTVSTASTASSTTSNAISKSSDDKDNDKENDNRTTQAAIQRRRKPKRRSTGVVHLDMDDLDPERQDSANDTEEKESGSERTSRSRVGSSNSLSNASATDDKKSRDKSENGDGPIDYKALWEAAKSENDKLKQQLKKKDEEVVQTRATLERFTNATTKNSLSEIEKRERRAMERKLSEMEEELKQLEVYKTENQRLKEENGALIRVISKLSK
ncbi:protein phosphatase 1 regulatory subunit 12A isoform X2 [Teleopsis dalmanni]|uniref:protein phosphatase 1 regulatory subunit 12A isoform X2 n=1 Tax=Teleopsis dalmanni TaxID=139649 RepID=UPI0018CFD448|nr:protein phosphatase 1 regulatory subunit 12A isoform X2 [Teleopsis dalmanni]